MSLDHLRILVGCVHSVTLNSSLSLIRKMYTKKNDQLTGTPHIIQSHVTHVRKSDSSIDRSQYFN